MHVSFGRRLKALGRMKIGSCFLSDGLMGWSMLLLIAMLRMSWYMMLGVLWMMYGLIYLCFILPIRGIARLGKRNKKK